MFKNQNEPSFVPMSSTKIRSTMGRVVGMNIDHITQFRESILNNVRIMYSLGGYNRLQLDEHNEWLNMLGQVSWSILNQEQIDWETIEIRLLMNSCIRKLQLTDQAYHLPILKELDELDTQWILQKQGNVSEHWPALLNI